MYHKLLSFIPKILLWDKEHNYSNTLSTGKNFIWEKKKCKSRGKSLTAVQRLTKLSKTAVRNNCHKYKVIWVSVFALT